MRDDVQTMDDMKPATTTNQQIQVITVTSLEGLELYAEQWDQLALQSPQQLPMLSAAWVMPYLEHCLAPNESWTCYLAITPDRRLVGILPLVIRPHPVWRSFLPILHTPYDEHTRCGDLLVASGMENLVFERFLVALFEQFGSSFVLEIKGIRDNSPTLLLLKRKIHGWSIWLKSDRLGYFIFFDKPLEKFMETLSSGFKQNLRKSNRRLAKSLNYSFTSVTNSAAVHHSFEKFLELESSGWKGKSGTAIKCSLKLNKFYYELVQRLSERGWLELDFLEVEGKPIAGLFAVQFGSALAFPKSAYDEAYSFYSPGNLLLENIVKQAFNGSKYREINFVGNTKWLEDWKVDKVTYYQLYLFPRHPVPLLLERIPRILFAWFVQVPWVRRIYQKAMSTLAKLGLLNTKKTAKS